MNSMSELESPKAYKNLINLKHETFCHYDAVACRIVYSLQQ